jgi:SnoaL-like protein
MSPELAAAADAAAAGYEGPPFAEGDHESVVRWFAAGWDGPGSSERFCDHFVAGFTSDVRLIQPGTRTTVGHGEFRSLFGGLFSLIPDLRADVHRWAPSGDSVYIEFTLSGTMGSRRVSWPAVDRLVLRDGLVAERRSWFDPGTLFAAIARHPRSWPRAGRMLAGNLARR